MNVRNISALALLAAFAMVQGCSGSGEGNPVEQCDTCMAFPDDPLAGKIDPGDPTNDLCPNPDEWPAPDLSVSKMAMNLLHFNVQYVAGGLIGFGDPAEDEPGGMFAYDEWAIEDLIIEQSFNPVIDFYLEHPNWHATIELQGYMIEIMAKRHAAYFEKLKTLVMRRQWELISFHWSDQLFLAFPRVDMEVSLSMTDKSFRGHCLPVGDSVFTQEGQFDPGMASLMVEHDRSILMLPKNLYKYYHVADEADGMEAYYYMTTHPNVDVVVVGKGVETADVTTTWTFFDDGELLATNDMNPYFGKAFRAQETAMNNYRDELAGLEAQGYKHVTVREYVAWLKAKGVERTELPVVHGGPWQPKDTRNIHLWMGGCYLNTVCINERDNTVRTRNYATGLRLRAVDAVMDYLRGNGFDQAMDDLRDERTRAWQYQLFAEVSDASAWNPSKGEIQYSYRYDGLANTMADALMQRLEFYGKADGYTVNLEDNTVTKGETPVDPVGAVTAINDSAAPLPVTFATFAGRSQAHQWFVAPADPGLHVLTVDFGAATQGEAKDDHGVSVTFPRSGDKLIFSPSLIDNEVWTQDLADYDFQKGETSLPLANGLVGLGNGVYVITDNRVLHIAAIVPKAEQTVLFLDESQGFDETATWRFIVLTGKTDQQALAFARALNTHPVITP